MGVVLVYAGLVVMLAGAASIIRPLRFLRIGSRRTAAAVLLAGFLLGIGGAAWPAGLMESPEIRTYLDSFLPSYQFHEVHTIRVHASPDQVYRAVKEVTPGEIRFLRELLAIRSLPARLLGKGGPPAPMKGYEVRSYSKEASAAQPILDLFLRSGFLMLAEEPGRGIVIGCVDRYWAIEADGASPSIGRPEDFRAFDAPDYAKVAANFLVEDEGAGWTRVTTETRILATDAVARRKFAVYWRLIYPGSATIRRTWLGAIKRRAETGSGAEG